MEIPQRLPACSARHHVLANFDQHRAQAFSQLVTVTAGKFFLETTRQLCQLE